MTEASTHSRVVILDFGSQYTQVIARRIRECQVYSEIVRFDTPAAEIAALKPNGIILSGGPASVYDKGAPQIDAELFSFASASARWIGRWGPLSKRLAPAFASKWAIRRSCSV